MIGNKIVLSLTLIACLFLSFSFTYEKPAYNFFSKNGESVTYSKVVKAISNADVVLFGELHNNPICHWMELSLIKDLYKEKKNIAVGAEMFEADDQLILNEYMKGKITLSHLKNEAKVWENFDTDYYPILAFAVSNKVNFFASNIPRRYASLVSREGLKGLDSLSDEAKKYMAPLPIEVDLTLPGYESLSMMVPHGNNPSLNFLPEAQAVKDATMAHFISLQLKTGVKVFHINGAYHSQNYEGIYWFLKKKNPDLKIVTITSVEQKDAESLDPKNKNTADFILAIPSDMTKTH